MTTDELLNKYGELTKEADKERPLFNLLYANKTEITGLIEEDSSGYWFHKAFRQIDVCESPYTDIAIWILLGDSVLFWEMLEKENSKSVKEMQVVGRASETKIAECTGNEVKRDEFVYLDEKSNT